MGLDWILGRLSGGCILDPVGSGLVPVVDTCLYSDEPSGSCTMVLVTYLVCIE
jgi:hypothetical protein